jgi:hypothetical protein
MTVMTMMMMMPVNWELYLLFRSPRSGTSAVGDIYSSPQHSVDIDHTSLHERSYVECKSFHGVINVNMSCKSAVT